MPPLHLVFDASTLLHRPKGGHQLKPTGLKQTVFNAFANLPEHLVKVTITLPAKEGRQVQELKQLNLGHARLVPHAEAVSGDWYFTNSRLKGMRNHAQGLPTTVIQPNHFTEKHNTPNTLALGWDLDGVVFKEDTLYKNLDTSDPSHKSVYYTRCANQPRMVLQPGPFAHVLQKLVNLQPHLAEHGLTLELGAITARGKRAIDIATHSLKTLFTHLHFDSFHAMDGKPKQPIIKATGIDLFIDDTPHHLKGLAGHSAAGWVPPVFVPKPQG